MLYPAELWAQMLYLYCPDYTVLNRFIMHLIHIFNILCKKKRRGRDSPYRSRHRFCIFQAASLTGVRHPCRPSPVIRAFVQIESRKSILLLCRIIHIILQYAQKKTEREGFEPSVPAMDTTP